MENMTITQPLEYITLGNITYKVNPIKNLEHIQVVTDFEKYLDKLPAEIFNRAVQKYAECFDLHCFSEMIKADYISQIEPLKKCIVYFKQAVKESISDIINELCKLDDETDVELISPTNKEYLTKLIQEVLEEVDACVNYAENNHLTDEQVFLNFEDMLNAYSIKEHPEYRHSYLGVQLETKHK